MYGLINHASAYSCNRSTTWTALSAEAFDKWQRILDLGNVYSVIQEEHTASFFDKIRKECRRLAHAGIGYHRTKEAAQTFVYCLFCGGGRLWVESDALWLGALTSHKSVCKGLRMLK